MLQRHIATTLLAISLLAGALGCQSDVESKVALAGLSSACRINSDCSAELVCVFERCHNQCKSSRDCEHAARCVAGQGKRNVCQLADEAACSKSGACPGAEVCGADAVCRDACSSDGECLAEQVCSGGTCADTAEVDAAGQLTPAPDRPPAPQPCAFDSDCPAELLCVAGACATQCESDGACRAGEVCRDGHCQAPVAPSAGCLRNSDCGKAEQCVAGACQKAATTPVPECAHDSDCQTPGQHCTDGACHCECATDADCSTNQLCEGACQCVPHRVIVGNVNVTNARQLEALRDVVEITGQLTLNIPGFGEYHVPHLRKVGFLGALEHKATIVLDALEETTGLNCYQDCRAPRLKSAGTVVINSEVIREVALPALETVENLSIWYNSELTRISLPQLKSAKILRLEGNGKLTSVALPELGPLDSVVVGLNDRLATLSLPKATPAVSIAISGNSALTNIALPSASQLADVLSIGNLPLLESLDFRGLQQVKEVTLYQMPKLSQLDLTSLSDVTDNFQINYGSGPAVLELPALAQASMLTLFHVEGVGSIHAPALTQLNALSAFSCPQLTEVGLPLQSLPTQLYLQDNAKLSLVEFPNLQQVATLHVVGSPELALFTFPALTSVGPVTIGQTAISNLDWLNPDLAGVLATAGDMTFSFNPALPACALNALGTALTAKGWTGSIYQHDNLDCSCNGAVCQ